MADEQTKNLLSFPGLITLYPKCFIATFICLRHKAFPKVKTSNQYQKPATCVCVAQHFKYLQKH